MINVLRKGFGVKQFKVLVKDKDITVVNVFGWCVVIAKKGAAL